MDHNKNILPPTGTTTSHTTTGNTTTDVVKTTEVLPGSTTHAHGTHAHGTHAATTTTHHDTTHATHGTHAHGTHGTTAHHGTTATHGTHPTTTTSGVEHSKITIELGKGSGGLEAARTIATGQVPPNATLLESLEAAKHSVESQKTGLDPQGKVIASDAQRVIEATKHLITDKNSDEKLQQMIYHTREGVKTGARTKAPRTHAKTVSNDVVTIAREVATVLTQSSDLRGLLLEQIQLFQRLFWNRMKSGTSGTGSIDSFGQQHYSSGHSMPSALPRGNDSLFQTSPTSITTDTHSTYIPTTPEILNSFGPGVTTTYGSGIPTSTTGYNTNVAAPFGAAPLQTGVAAPHHHTGVAAPLGTGVAPLHTGALPSVVPTATGMSTHGYETTGTRGFASSALPSYGSNNENFETITLTPQERRELIDSFRTLFSRIGEKPNYRNVVEGMFRLIEHLGQMKDQTKADPNAQASAQTGKQVGYEAREMIERFTGGKSLDDLIRMTREFISYMRNEPEVREFFDDWSSYSSTVLQDPTLLKREEYAREMEELIDRSVHMMNVPYFRTHSRGIAYEAKEIIERISNDPNISELTDSFSKLFKDLALDEHGNPSLGKLAGSVQQMKTVLLPILIEQFNYIPISKVYGVTPKYDFGLSNIVLSASDLIPDRMVLELHNKADVSLNSNNDEVRTKLVLKISNITVNMKNVHFFYVRKRMPKIEDEGTVDVTMPGYGARIKIVWEIVTRSNKPLTFNFRRATCDINDIKINVIQARHRMLDRIVTKLFANTMRSRMESAIADGLSNVGNGLSDRMNGAIRGRKSYNKPINPTKYPGFTGSNTHNNSDLPKKAPTIHPNTEADVRASEQRIAQGLAAAEHGVVGRDAHHGTTGVPAATTIPATNPTTGVKQSFTLEKEREVVSTTLPGHATSTTTTEGVIPRKA